MLRLHPGFAHPVEQTPLVQDPGRVRTQLQTGSDLAEAVGALQEADLAALAGEAVGALTIAVPSARFAPERREELLRALSETLARAERDVAGFTG